MGTTAGIAETVLGKLAIGAEEVNQRGCFAPERVEVITWPPPMMPPPMPPAPFVAVAGTVVVMVSPSVEFISPEDTEITH